MCASHLLIFPLLLCCRREKAESNCNSRHSVTINSDFYSLVRFKQTQPLMQEKERERKWEKEKKRRRRRRWSKGCYISTSEREHRKHITSGRERKVSSIIRLRVSCPLSLSLFLSFSLSPSSTCSCTAATVTFLWCECIHLPNMNQASLKHRSLNPSRYLFIRPA